MALQSAPQHETAWARGAEGEKTAATSLARHARGEVIFLHDRRIPGSRANIDHIAIAPSGVWVIDTKRYRGRVQIKNPLFGQRRLVIAGRNATNLIDGLERQVELVRSLLDGHLPPDVVHGALCFVDADLPGLGSMRWGEYAIAYPRRLAKLISQDGPVATAELPGLASVLADRVPEH